MPFRKKEQKRESLAKTVARNPLTGAPVVARKGRESKKIERAAPPYFKKFAPERDENGNRVTGLIRKDMKPLPGSAADKNNPFLHKDEPAPVKVGLRLVDGGKDAATASAGKGKSVPKSKQSKTVKPEVLMEDEQTHFNKMMGLENDDAEQDKAKDSQAKNLGIPDVSNDPEILAAEEAVKKAQYDAEKLVARKKMMAMVADGNDPDPDKVEELCAQEPWKRGGLTELSLDLFGFVPNKFKFMAEKFDDGSAEYTRYMDAYQKSCDIYNEQITKTARQTFNAIARQHPDPVSARAAAENLNARINAFRKGAHMEMDPILGYQSGMLMRAMIVIGHNAMNNNGGTSWGKGVTEDGRKYEKFVLKPGGDIKPTI